MSDEFAALADQLLAAGREDELLEQLGHPEIAELWDDPAFLGAVAEAHGRRLGGSALMDLAVLREPRTALVIGGLVRAAGEARHLVLVTDAGPRRAAAVPLEPLGGLDPSLGLARVPAGLEGEPLDADGGALLARAARFLAHELTGVAAGALALAVEHVRSRHQFGVPIGSFQAVRHRLAEAHVRLVAARELLAALPDADLDTSLLVLKASAGDAARSAVAEAQQVCGGMGFTEEFGLHRYVRRALVLDSLLVPGEDAAEALGRLAIGGRVLPDRQVVLP